jgi:hypothetical protein
VTVIQQREIEKDTSRPGIIVNACCPGYCKTDMASNQIIGGLLTAEQGYISFFQKKNLVLLNILCDLFIV